MSLPIQNPQLPIDFDLANNKEVEHVHDKVLVNDMLSKMQQMQAELEVMQQQNTEKARKHEGAALQHQKKVEEECKWKEEEAKCKCEEAEECRHRETGRRTAMLQAGDLQDAGCMTTLLPNANANPTALRSSTGSSRNLHVLQEQWYSM